MKLILSPEAAKQLAQLPKPTQKKARKQFSLLLTNYRYPSLRTRKMGGENKFEARIDIRYRFTFTVEEKMIYVLIIGPHDTGLGKN